MKVLIVALSLVAASLAGESPFGTNTFQNGEDLAGLNAAVMERLRQEPGSERGSYHVFLSDGRLQRVQYTAAPLVQSKDYSAPAPASAGFVPRAVYHVEVPAERLQAARAQQTFQQQQSNDYSNQAAPSDSAARSAYYVEVPAERLQALRAQQAVQQGYQQQVDRSASYSQPLEVDAQFVPLQVVTVEQLAQYNSQY